MNPAETFLGICDGASQAMLAEPGFCQCCRERKPVQRHNFFGESIWICDWCMGAAVADEIGEGVKRL
jgi:hypothetical protein